MRLSNMHEILRHRRQLGQRDSIPNVPQKVGDAHLECTTDRLHDGDGDNVVVINVDVAMLRILVRSCSPLLS